MTHTELKTIKIQTKAKMAKAVTINALPRK